MNHMIVYTSLHSDLRGVLNDLHYNSATSTFVHACASASILYTGGHRKSFDLELSFAVYLATEATTLGAMWVPAMHGTAWPVN